MGLQSVENAIVYFCACLNYIFSISMHVLVIFLYFEQFNENKISKLQKITDFNSLIPLLFHVKI